MTNFERYIQSLTAEKFADSMALNCMGCPAYPCTESVDDRPDTGDECYERLLAWCNEVPVYNGCCWLKRPDSTYITKYRCSACGREFFENRDLIREKLFCYSCGADMRGADGMATVVCRRSDWT